MDFSAYPFDQQKCYMKLESYQYRAFEVTYSWHDNGIQTSSDIRTDHFIPAFEIIKGSIVHDNASFSSVRVDIILSRKATYHLMNTYIPSSLFVFVSWLTFLIPPEHLPGRTVLTITTLLTIVSMFNTVRQESPKVSYAKAIDQWMMFCIVLVFTVLVEYTYVVHLHFRAEQLRMVSVEPKRNPRQTGGTGSQANSPRPELYTKWKVRFERLSPRVLIVIFIIFNITYWSYWLSYSVKHSQWLNCIIRKANENFSVSALLFVMVKKLTFTEPMGF
ncbi:glycine receptor subunit alpha-2 [Penaeus vannamei]|uniref:glycine receptor subunit alpha-2 n=1 Tax=Penaeus vannamei TaxID=6689 RepID=UPI00387F48F8